MNKKEESARRKLTKFNSDKRQKNEELKYNVSHSRRRKADEQYIEAELDRLYEEGNL